MVQKCDICEKESELGYDDLNDRYMCEQCWDEYYEACYYGGLTKRRCYRWKISKSHVNVADQRTL